MLPKVRHCATKLGLSLSYCVCAHLRRYFLEFQPPQMCSCEFFQKPNCTVRGVDDAARQANADRPTSGPEKRWSGGVRQEQKQQEKRRQ